MNKQQLCKLHEEVLKTQVRVSVNEKSGGSGTIIYSKKNSNGIFSNYVLTCYHVIASAISIKTEWSTPPIGHDVKKEYRQVVKVEFFDYEAVPHGRRPVNYSVDGDILAYDVTHDMALIKLRNIKQYKNVAKILPIIRKEEMCVGSDVCAVGAALLHDPILTFGKITHMGDEINFKDYWMSNANIIFGNSGGAIFYNDTKEYFIVGVPSMVDIVGWGTPVTHLGYFSPLNRIYDFLEEQMFNFITDPTISEEDCNTLRKNKEDEERKKGSFLSVQPVGMNTKN